MTEDKAGRGAGPSVGMWVGGALAGAAIGAVFWYVATTRAPLPDEETPLALVPQSETEVEPEAPADEAAPAADAPTVEEASAEAVPDAPVEESAAAVEPEAEAGSDVEQAALPEAMEPQAAPETADESQEATEEPVPPSFDTVRADADGSVLVAGRAEPGAHVSVLVDGAVATDEIADAGGSFAAFLSLDPSDAPRVLTLVARDAGGIRTASAQSVIIAPIAGPEELAAVAPDAAAPETSEAASAETPASTEETTAEEAGTSAYVPAASAPVGEETALAEEAPAAGTEETPVEAETDVAAAETQTGATAPEVLIVDETGVHRQATTPVEGVVIDTIGYGAEGEVQIAGRGTAGLFTRLYLNNREIVTAPIGETGAWATVLTDVAPGIYTLRVDQVDAAGKVSARFETPFQREAPEAVAAARGDAAPEVVPAEPATPAAPEADVAAVATADTAIARPESGSELSEQPPGAPEKPALLASVVTVQPGFTLWRIARENYGEGVLYVKVFEANKDQIRNPDLIYPGQVFTVPIQ